MQLEQGLVLVGVGVGVGGVVVDEWRGVGADGVSGVGVEGAVEVWGVGGGARLRIAGVAA